MSIFQAILKLLDEKNADVQNVLAEWFINTDGDFSEALLSMDHPVTTKQKSRISYHVRPALRRKLIESWYMPTNGLKTFQYGVEDFEALLLAISEFLHDGVSFRLPLSDALDILAEEAKLEGVSTAKQLNDFLFKSKRFEGNRGYYYDPRNSDLAWCLDQGTSNPLGLALIYILVGERLGLEVQGVNFPGHFLCRILIDDKPVIVDVFQGGQMREETDFYEAFPKMNTSEFRDLVAPATPSMMLGRLLRNTIMSFEKLHAFEIELQAHPATVKLSPEHAAASAYPLGTCLEDSELLKKILESIRY